MQFSGRVLTQPAQMLSAFLRTTKATQFSIPPLPSCLLNSANKQQIKCFRKGCVPFLDLILGINLVFVLLPQTWWWNFRNLANINSRQLQMFIPLATARISAYLSLGICWPEGRASKNIPSFSLDLKQRDGRNCIK